MVAILLVSCSKSNNTEVTNTTGQIFITNVNLTKEIISNNDLVANAT